MNKYTPECSSQFVNALQGGPGKACVKAAFVTGRVIGDAIFTLNTWC